MHIALLNAYESMENTEKVKPLTVPTIGKDSILFFDMDGTLIDTDGANYLAYKKAVNAVIHIDIDPLFNRQQRFNRQVLKDLFPSITDAKFEKITQAKEYYYKDFLSETRLIRENADILYQYSSTNPCYLITNCLKDRALVTLDYHGLTDKFKGISCKEIGDETVNKYSKALSMFGISPQNIVVFENEEAEKENAKEVGIKRFYPMFTFQSSN